MKQKGKTKTVTKKGKTPTKEKQIEKITKMVANKPNRAERSVMWCVHNGLQTAGKIADSTSMSEDEAKYVLEELRSRFLVDRGFTGSYRLTDKGRRHLDGKISLATKLMEWNIKHGQETDLWVHARNTGSMPMDNVLLRITSPKFVDVGRYNSVKTQENEKNIIEFPIAQLHPGESQHVNFRVRGFLTSGGMNSKYRLDVQALSEDKELFKKQISMNVGV